MHRTLPFLLLGLITLATPSSAQTPPQGGHTLVWKSGEQQVESPARPLARPFVQREDSRLSAGDAATPRVTLRFRDSEVTTTAPHVQPARDNVRPVQFEEESPVPARVSLTQNQPVEADDLFGDFDDLDQAIDAATDDAQESDPLDDLLETPPPAAKVPGDEPPSPPERAPMEAPKMQPPRRRSSPTTPNDSKAHSRGEVVDTGTPLQDSYDTGYSSSVRRRRRNAQPMTLGDILIDENEQRNCRCEKEYCRRVWQCNGGRGGNWMQRWSRDLNRNRVVKNAARSGRQPFFNDFKCCDKGRDGCDQCGFQPGGPGPGPRFGRPRGEYIDGEYVEGAYIEGIYIDGRFIRGDGSQMAEPYEFEPELTATLPEASTSRSE